MLAITSGCASCPKDAMGLGTDLVPPVYAWDGALGLSEEDKEAIAKRLAMLSNDFTEMRSTVALLETIPEDGREEMVQMAIARGGNPAELQQAMNMASPFKSMRRSKATWTVLGVLSTVSMGASAYHGYRRNQSLPWALSVGFFGGLFPVLTPAIALAQGFGKKKTK